MGISRIFRALISLGMALLAAMFYYFGRRSGILGAMYLESTGEVDVWLFLLQGIVAAVALQDTYAGFLSGESSGNYTYTALSRALKCLAVFHLALAGLRVALRNPRHGVLDVLISGSGALGTSLCLVLLGAFVLAALAEAFLQSGTDQPGPTNGKGTM